MSKTKALEGQWYSDRSTHDVFCVIGVDESEGLIGVRDGYGDVDEFDFDEWDSMDLVVCAAPEGWVRDDSGEEFDSDQAAPRMGDRSGASMQKPNEPAITPGRALRDRH